MSQPVPERAAQKIWDLLVKHVHPRGNSGWDRLSFVTNATEGTWTEWRFQGSLGFGGKVWNNAGRWYVTCYPEDATPEREAMIEKVNAALAKLYEETCGQPSEK